MTHLTLYRESFLLAAIGLCLCSTLYLLVSHPGMEDANH